MKQKPEIETLYEIWPNDGDGWSVEVGPDRDGLGCVEIRFKEDGHKIKERMTFGPEIALLVGEAIVKAANDSLNKSKKMA
jgi:hypothetical protein